MNRLFFTICFILCNVFINSAEAGVQSIVGTAQPPAQPALAHDAVPEGLPDRNNTEEVRQFLKKRLEEAARFTVKKDADLSNVNSVNVIHTPEYYQAQKEKEKPLFQKMYEKAISAIHQEENSSESTYSNNVSFADDKQIAEAATRFFTIEQNKNTQSQPQVPTVAFSLPSGKRVLAPAREHIPYFLSYIDVQANGYIKVEDTIILVANGKKFSSALTRMFPKYAADNQRMEFMLENVTVNGTKIPYTIEEIGNNIVLKPKYNQRIEPGIYTYVFKYIVNNKLTRSGDNNIILNWNLTGRPLNTVITSANAIITLPTGHSFDNTFTMIGAGNRFTDRRSNMFRFDGNTIAFSSNTPILNGENVNIFAEMNKNIFINDFDKNFSNFITNWGNIAYATLGLIAIVGSFILSLLGLRRERKNNKYNPSYNGALMRSILVGKYDRTSFVAQLLDLYRKKALDITQSDNRLFLHKKTIDKSKLQKHEIKAMKALFPKKEISLEINNTNNVVIKKANHLLARKNLKQIKKYRIIHNISYLLFSCAMLILTEAFISFISVNFAQTLIILLATTLLYAFYIWIVRHRFKRWYVAVPTKLFALISMVVIWIFSSIYVGAVTSIIIMLMVAVIFAFTRIFGEQNNFVNEAKQAIASYKEYLQTNADAINLSRDFINQQSSIFALDITEYFPQNISNKDYYKLDIAENIKQSLIGII